MSGGVFFELSGLRPVLSSRLSSLGTFNVMGLFWALLFLPIFGDGCFSIEADSRARGGDGGDKRNDACNA